MDWDAAAKVGASVGGVGLALGKFLLDFRSRGGQRDQIKRDLEIVGLMPEGAPGRARLLEHIERSIEELVGNEEEKRRDPSGIVLGLAMVGLGTWFATLAVGGSAAWWFAAVPIGLIGLVGFVQDVTPHRRDERGRLVRES